MTNAGKIATMNVTKRNKTPNKAPKNYSDDVCEIDIGFRPCMTIRGIRYTLMAVDKKTKFKFI